MNAKPIGYEVFNRNTGKVKTYKTSNAAYNAADKIDYAYGAVICTVKPIWS